MANTKKQSTCSQFVTPKQFMDFMWASTLFVAIGMGMWRGTCYMQGWNWNVFGPKYILYRKHDIVVELSLQWLRRKLIWSFNNLDCSACCKVHLYIQKTAKNLLIGREAYVEIYCIWCALIKLQHNITCYINNLLPHIYQKSIAFLFQKQNNYTYHTWAT